MIFQDGCNPVQIQKILNGFEAIMVKETFNNSWILKAVFLPDQSATKLKKNCILHAKEYFSHKKLRLW